MKGFELSAEKIEELKAIHREALKRRAKEAYKLNALILLGSGWSVEEVSEALLLSDETLRSYVEKYRLGHLNSLFKKYHKGRSSKLDDKQQRALKNELSNTVYLRTKDVCHYVRNRYGVHYSLSGMYAR